MTTPLFVRTISLKARLALALGLALLLIFLDYRVNAMQPARMFMNSFVSPVQQMAVWPEQVFDNLVIQFSSRQHLITENEQLKRDVLELHGQMQQHEFILGENERLRSLLGSEARTQGERVVGEVIAVDSDPFTHQIVVNKGTTHGVYIGQPVVDHEGIIGQVSSVGINTARIIMISDQSHAIPARSDRNGVRVVVHGAGDTRQLEIPHIPHSTDLREGDSLVSSGLGGVFPEGYPIATISEIERDESLPFARVYARPTASLDRIRMVLLLFDTAGEVEQ